MRDYVLTLEPGEQLPVYATGNYVRVREALGPVQLETPSGNRLSVLAGEAVRLDTFQELRARNTHSQRQTVCLAVGTGAIESARGVVTLDSVPGVEWPAYRYSVTGNAAGGNYPALQIINPDDSGKDLYVARLEISSGSTGASITRAAIGQRLDKTGMGIAGGSFGAFETGVPASVVEGAWGGDSGWTPFSPPLTGFPTFASFASFAGLGAGEKGIRDFTWRPQLMKPGESIYAWSSLAGDGMTLAIEYEERDA